MQLGIITPIAYLKYCNSDFRLCYTTLLNNPEYFHFFKRCGRNVVYLDYAPQLPRKTNIFHLYTAAQELQPAAVVLPGVDYSCESTITQAKVFLNLGGYPNMIGCVQGYDIDSLAECYRFLRKHCSMIGLTSPLETIARREEIARDLGITEGIVYIEIHNSPYDEIPPKSAAGIFTSFPLRLAAAHRVISDFRPTPEPLDFYTEDLVEELVEKNISEYEEVLRYA